MDKLDRTIACNSIIEKLDILIQKVECGAQPDGGICYQVESGYSELLGDRIPSYVKLWLEHKVAAFQSWPQFSGSDEYPVPATSKYAMNGRSPGVFGQYHNFPRWVGEQRDLRLSLARHLIEYFEELGHAS